MPNELYKKKMPNELKPTMGIILATKKQKLFKSTLTMIMQQKEEKGIKKI